VTNVLFCLMSDKHLYRLKDSSTHILCLWILSLDSVIPLNILNKQFLSQTHFLTLSLSCVFAYIVIQCCIKIIVICFSTWQTLVTMWSANV